jgi:phosphoribosylamine--glycine ligase
MNLLVIGKGGREHALVWKLAQSPRVGRVFCAPGNAGTAVDGVNVPLEADDFDKLARFALKEQVGLTIVGPEEPLARGIVDHFRKAGLRVFGPTKEAAQLEASKVFAKQLMRHADVPTAEFRVFDHPDPARHFIQNCRYPVVVKADGLAAGKGVIVCSTTEDALAAVERVMVREEFGRAAGRQIVVEKRMQGEELSVLAVAAGRTAVMLPACQDHKALLDGDQGPNTGGMGAYCPAPAATPALLDTVERDVMVATLHALRRRKTPFGGVLYAGLMLTNQGPRVLEFNCRFGDPECQPLLLRLRSDLLDLLEAAADERLEEVEGKVEWDPRPAVCVVLASKGYPGKYEKGYAVKGVEEAEKLPGVKVFHAGTRRDGDRVLTDGGRVLGVTALGDDLADAQRRAYEAVGKIAFADMVYRRDIAARALARPHGG